MKRSYFKRTRGFTLIELLIVIAIIGMLSSLALPVLKTGIQKAEGAKCVSNLGQIGVAVGQYIADPDNGGKFPAIYNTGATNAAVASDTTGAGGASSLQPLQALSNYGVTMTLLTCPSDKHPSPVYGSYIWSPVLQGEQPQDVHIYGRGGVFSINRLSKLTVATDNGMIHLGKLNVLRGDGHVETKP